MEMILNPPNSVNGHANGHRSQPATSAADVECPYCGRPVSRKEYREIHSRIEAEQRERIAKIEEDLKARVVRDIAKVEATKKVEIAKAVRQATKTAEGKLQALRSNQDAIISARLEAEREKAAKATAEAVVVAKLQHAAEKLKLEAALAEMQRRLRAKTAHELGEPAEVDLHDALVAAFPGDQISRVGKGQRGPDIRMDVLLPNSAVAGRIILDSKAISRWSNRLTVKLRSDQLSEKADFALLVSSSFPNGTRELHLQDGVLVVSPSRVIVVVQFLRQQILANHRLKLSADARDEKGDRLLSFLTSADAADRFDRLAKATDDMIDLEARELDMQTGIHRKRGEMIRAIQANYEEIVAAIESILGGNQPEDLEMLV